LEKGEEKENKKGEAKGPQGQKGKSETQNAAARSKEEGGSHDSGRQPNEKKKKGSVKTFPVSRVKRKKWN